MWNFLRIAKVNNSLLVKSDALHYSSDLFMNGKYHSSSWYWPWIRSVWNDQKIKITPLFSHFFLWKKSSSFSFSFSLQDSCSSGMKVWPISGRKEIISHFWVNDFSHGSKIIHIYENWFSHIEALYSYFRSYDFSSRYLSIFTERRNKKYEVTP